MTAKRAQTKGNGKIRGDKSVAASYRKKGILNFETTVPTSSEKTTKDKSLKIRFGLEDFLESFLT